MTLDEAFAALGVLDAALPAEAMQVLLDEWDGAAPRCRALLHDYVAGRDLSEATERALFPILHLLAERTDTAAFADICALLADPERVGLILADAVLRTMPCIVISCFDGETARLQALIEQADGDPMVREGVLMAMAYLAQIRRIPRTEMHAYLVALHDKLPAEPEFIVWVGWVRAVALLGFRALAGKATAVFEQGLISAEVMTLEDFRSELRLALQDPASPEGFYDVGIGPLGSAIAALEGGDDDDGPPLETPFKNPLRDVGRNDPCPCGSGQKYKKCCLVAA